MSSVTVPLIAQGLVGFYFAFYGFWNVYHWFSLLENMTEKNIPHPYLFLSIGIAWQTTAGFLILFGIYVKFVALTLLPFMILSGFFFHPFWKARGESRQINFAIFFANVTMGVGALLMLAFPWCPTT